jgi:thiamine pyrophosphokinase
MNVLEQEMQEIVERFQRLNHEQQLDLIGILDVVAHEITAKPFDYNHWFGQLDSIHDQLRARYGENYTVGSQSLLDELREEASWPYRSS